MEFNEELFKLVELLNAHGITSTQQLAQKLEAMDALAKKLELRICPEAAGVHVTAREDGYEFSYSIGAETVARDIGEAIDNQMVDTLIKNTYLGELKAELDKYKTWIRYFEDFYKAFEDACLDPNAAYLLTGSGLDMLELLTSRLNHMTEKEKKIARKVISEPVRIA